jgi:hypothetical protein
LTYSTRRASNTTRNTCGRRHAFSVRFVFPKNPTLRIGLISATPSASMADTGFQFESSFIKHIL